MELVLSLGIGILTASGVWLILRPRTYQVIIGLSLLSYAVNLFIFGVGGLKKNAPPLSRRIRKPSLCAKRLRSCSRSWRPPA